MHILIVNTGKIPALKYGGTERVIWWLGKELVEMGHKVSYLVSPGSECHFADVQYIEEGKSWDEQIPKEVDIVHFQFPVRQTITKPHIITIHGNTNSLEPFDVNSLFVSQDHARRHGSNVYVHNGIDWDEYGKPDMQAKRKYLHFLAKAAWRVKNVKGAIELAGRSKEKLAVIGGTRLNLSMGFRLTLDPNVSFYGMVGGEEKLRLINASKALLFPVLWHEPFGLSIIESLYFGCPVIATPYGSLPELIKPEYGHLSSKKDELVRAIKNIDYFNRKECHEYARENFSAKLMATRYLKLYEKVLRGEKLNERPPVLLEQQKEKFLPFN